MYTDTFGVIVNDAKHKVVGSWFINLGKIGFDTPDATFNDLVRTFQEKGVRTLETEYKRCYLHDLPTETVKTLFAAAGYHLLTAKDVKEPENPIQDVTPDKSLEQLYWRCPRYYAVRTEDARIVAIVNFTTKGPLVTTSIDASTMRELTALLSRKAVVTIREAPFDGFIENAVELPPATINVFTAQQLVGPDYYLLPAAYAGG